MHHFKIHNREVELCRLVSKSDCGIQYSDAVAERGTAYFEELYSRYKRIQKEPNQSLTRYNVDYVVIQGESVNKDMVLKKLIVEGDYTVYQVDKDTLNVRE